MNPRLLLFHGHGNNELIAGFGGKVLIHSEKNAHFLQDKIVHSFTCSSASVLGRKSVEQHNTIAFIGYEDPFIALTDDYKSSRPLEDEIATPFIESAMKISDALIKGNTTGESYKKSQDLYEYWITYYRENGHLKDASDILLYLIADKESQVIIGKTDISVPP